MIERLENLNIRCVRESEGTFYLWASIEELPGSLSDSEAFFRQALERKVMTVPGEFFAVNPGKRRHGPSPYEQWMRFSFGPPMDNMVMGLERLAEMVSEAR